MGKVKDTLTRVLDECYEVYQMYGLTGVVDHVGFQHDNPDYDEVQPADCKHCDTEVPSLFGVCLVCGQPIENVRPEPMSAEDVSIGQKIHRLAELRYLLEGCDDHDQICIETCDEHGDSEDLFPMYIDVIENVRLTDGTIVREIRFCQMPHENVQQPSEEAKQELVDKVIELLKADMYHGDVTVLDELLMKLPWEILKGSLPEEMWEYFNNLKNK